jgi:hypothetical protein
MCQRCKKKTANNSVPAGPSTSGTMAPPVPLVRRCEVCQKMPLEELVDGKNLCKIHSVEHKWNTRYVQIEPKQPTSAPKPFRKSHLYRIRPEDKVYLRGKRKRGSSSNRGSSDGHSRTQSRESDLANVGQGRRVASMQGESF